MTYQIIPAVAEDQGAIVALIREVRINPLQLKWQNFVVIKDENGRLLACGQLKKRPRGAIELASIAVVKSHRKQGLAKLIIEALLSQQAPPIWLMCLGNLVPFYTQFGFVEVTAVSQLPPFYKRIHRLSRLVHKLGRLPHKPTIMLKPQD